MAICKDCFHFDVCKDATIPNPEYKGVVADKSKECGHFINKADFAEVRHGEWKQGIPYICSICGNPAPDEKNTSEKYSCWTSPYCPHCGAKMDGRSDT